VELNAAGDDYLVHDPAVDQASSECWSVLKMVLADASERMTQQALLEEWPEDFHKPNQTTVGRALRRAVKEGHVSHDGSGLRNRPFRYWLPGKEVDFRPGWNASNEEMERWRERWRMKAWKAMGLDKAGAEADEACDGVTADQQDQTVAALSAGEIAASTGEGAAEPSPTPTDSQELMESATGDSPAAAPTAEQSAVAPPTPTAPMPSSGSAPAPAAAVQAPSTAVATNNNPATTAADWRAFRRLPP
jgi:hypothetical protein